MADLSAFDMGIDALSAVDPAREHKLALLAYPLLQGTAIAGHWVRMEKNNTIGSAGDANLYQTDWVITSDGHTVGYLDSEEKQQWLSGPWPWSYVNVAKHPMAHWKRGRFSGRLTNKLLSFRERPLMSFWVGVRQDYAAAMMVRASDLFAEGSEVLQHTRYSDTALPVIRIRQEFGSFVQDPSSFTNAIVRAFLETHGDR